MKAYLLLLTLALVLSLVTAGLALANGVERPRQVLGGGASDSADGKVSLRATLGQPLVGVVTASDGATTLGQGFWHGGAAAGQHCYLPLVVRDY
jgi:hypothetical protein